MRRVLIIRAGALGDTLMLLPGLKDLVGKAVITMVGRRPGLDIIRPYVDRAMDLDGQGWHRLFMDAPDENPIPVSDMDVAAAFFRDGDGMIERNLRQSLPGASIHLFPPFPSKETPIHVAEYLARCLETVGLPVDPGRAMAVAKGGGLCGDRPLAAHGRWIVCHPGSGSMEKNYPPDFWVDLTARMSRDAMFKGSRRVLLLGPAEASLSRFFAAHLGQTNVEIVALWDVKSLIEILNKAVLYLGHDSGVTHLAAIKSIPTVALFKTSDPNQWAPLGPWVRVFTGRNQDHDLIERILVAAGELIALSRTPNGP